MARLDHVGIAVDDVADVLQVFIDLIGEQAYRAERIDADGIRTHFVWGGSAKLEFLEAQDDRSPVARFLERRGPGLHHLAFEVDDVRAVHARMRDAGYEPIENEPRMGTDGKLIFFLHPKQTAGVLIEFCQSARPLLQPVAAPDIGSLLSLSRAIGSVSRLPCMYLFENAPAVDPDDLAGYLHAHRTFYHAEATPSLRVAELIDALDLEGVHLAADGALIPAALDAARDERIRSLLLVDPDASAVDRVEDIHKNLLVLARADENGMRQALAVRARRPTSRLAVVSDPELRAAIIASHLAKGPA